MRLGLSCSGEREINPINSLVHFQVKIILSAIYNFLVAALKVLFIATISISFHKIKIGWGLTLNERDYISIIQRNLI